MDIFSTLQFNQKWLELGIVTIAKLKNLEEVWKLGEDTNPEHYRWRTFLEFINSKESLNEQILKELYELGACDPDASMSRAMMADILRHRDCPIELLEMATNSTESSLQKIASAKLALLRDAH